LQSRVYNRAIVPTDGLPGGDLVAEGLRDLDAGVESIPALLVAIGRPRLERLGIIVPATSASPEHRLYLALVAAHGDAAHSRYNALLRRLVSFERAVECALANEARIRQFMRELGRAARTPARVYLSGGATAVLSRWRESTIDVDIKVVPEDDALFRAIPELKERLQINVELASPDDFIPVPAGWEDRSRFIGQEGLLTFLDFDLVAQALSKIERGHVQDLEDVRQMIARDLVAPAALRHAFAAIEPQLYRYPAIDPPSFRRALEAALQQPG
jgi:hypothetical protein